MPIKIGPGKVEPSRIFVNDHVQVKTVYVDAAKHIVFQGSDVETAVFPSTGSKSYRVSGGNLTGAQILDRDRLSYYGRSSTREEGCLFTVDSAAMQAFLTLKPNCSRIEISTSYQHSFGSSAPVQIGWMTLLTLPPDSNTGWIEPSQTMLRQLTYLKSIPPIRVGWVWEGADALTAAGHILSGAWSGFGVYGPGNAVNQWGWGGGAAEVSTTVSSGSPSGFAPVTPADRPQIEITSDF